MNRKLAAAVISAVMVFGAGALPLHGAIILDAAAAASEDAKADNDVSKLEFKVTANIIMEDGTEIPTEWEYTENKSADVISFDLRITEDMLKEVLSGRDKTLDEIDGVKYLVKAGAPDDLAQTPYSCIKYQTNIHYKYYGEGDRMVRQTASTAADRISYLDDAVAVYAGDTLQNIRADGIHHIDTSLNIYLDKAQVIEPTQAHLDALGVKYSPKACIRLKDGTELGTDFAFSIDEDNAEYRSFKTESIRPEALVKVLEENGKTIDDFDDMVLYFSTDIPDNSQFGDESTVKGLTLYCSADVKVKSDMKIEDNAAVKSADNDDKVYGVKAEDIFMGDCRLLTDKTVKVREEKDGIIDVVKRPAELGDIESFKLTARFGILETEVVRQEDKPVMLKGDVDLNGVVNVTDIAMVASHIKGVKALAGQGLKNADVDENGQVNVTDIAMIAAHIKGIKPLV